MPIKYSPYGNLINLSPGATTYLNAAGMQALDKAIRAEADKRNIKYPKAMAPNGNGIY